MAVAFGLMRDKVDNVLCLDENEVRRRLACTPCLCARLRHARHTPPPCSAPLQPGKEGPWVTYARMKTLRTPKNLTGLDYGMPSLTFQAF